MKLAREIKRRARLVILPVLYVCAAAYIGFHALQGERGIKVWSALKQQIEAATLERDRLAAERDRLDARAALLRKATLNRDMLDESVRRMLNYGRPDEIVIFYDRRVGQAPPPR
jgi:cell division protein FtsB